VGVPEDSGKLLIAPSPDLSDPFISIIGGPGGEMAIGGPIDDFYGYKLNVHGTMRCASLYEYSSRRFKRDVRPIQNALDKVSRLQGVSYVWDEEHGSGQDIGFIAEEVAEVVPEIVHMEPDGVNAVGMKYDRIGALAVEAIKEMHGLIRAQETQIQSLRAELAALRGHGAAAKPERGESSGLRSDYPCNFAD
jgi:hypothetical protein